jgi:hypothetical protein
LKGVRLPPGRPSIACHTVFHRLHIPFSFVTTTHGAAPPAHSPRDEPGPGCVRVGQTRSDLDCRVIATRVDASLRQSATVDSPFLAAARRVASDSSTPLAATRGGIGIRLVARLDSCVATCRPDRVRLVRHTWGVGGGPTRPTRPTLSGCVGRKDVTTRRDSSDSPSVESAPDSLTRRLLGLCRTKMSRAARLVRLAVGRKCPRLLVSSTRRLLGLCRTKMPRAARLVRLAVGRKCLRLLDSSTPRFGARGDFWVSR